jgi:hypothetical protein
MPILLRVSSVETDTSSSSSTAAAVVLVLLTVGFDAKVACFISGWSGAKVARAMLQLQSNTSFVEKPFATYFWSGNHAAPCE